MTLVGLAHSLVQVGDPAVGDNLLHAREAKVLSCRVPGFKNVLAQGTDRRVT